MNQSIYFEGDGDQKIYRGTGMPGPKTVLVENNATRVKLADRLGKWFVVELERVWTTDKDPTYVITQSRQKACYLNCYYHNLVAILIVCSPVTILPPWLPDLYVTEDTTTQAAS